MANGLLKKLQRIDSVLFGNRFTTLSFGLILGGAVLGFDSFSRVPNLRDIYHKDNSYETDSDGDLIDSNIKLGIGAFLMIAGFVGDGMTRSWGRSTREIYERTRESIENFGCLDERFALKCIADSENASFYGYCELQGLYLAARELGQLDTFRKIKQKYSPNVVPNF